jgi:hypothetical protein
MSASVGTGVARVLEVAHAVSELRSRARRERLHGLGVPDPREQERVAVLGAGREPLDGRGARPCEL